MPSHQFPNFVRIMSDVEARGGSIEEVLTSLRRAGASPIASMQVLHEVRGITVSEAKMIVWTSTAWADVRPVHDHLEADVDEYEPAPKVT